MLPFPPVTDNPVVFPAPLDCVPVRYRGSHLQLCHQGAVSLSKNGQRFLDSAAAESVRERR